MRDILSLEIISPSLEKHVSFPCSFDSGSFWLLGGQDSREIREGKNW